MVAPAVVRSPHSPRSCVHWYVLGQRDDRGEVHGVCKRCSTSRTWPADPAPDQWRHFTLAGNKELPYRY